MICAFSNDATSFDSLGNMVLQPTKAIVSEEENGEYSLQITCPLSYQEFIKSENILTAPTPKGMDAFRIKKIKTDKKRVTAFCKHLFYDLETAIVADTNVVVKNPNQAWAQLVNGADQSINFGFTSDIIQTSNFRIVRRSLSNAVFEMIENYGGRLVRNLFQIKLTNTNPKDRQIKIFYGKNLKELSKEENWDSVCTKILPVGVGGILLNKVDPSRNIYISSQTQYTKPYTKVIPFDQSHIDRESFPSENAYNNALVNDLENQAQIYLEQNSIPEINYTLTANVDIKEIGEQVQVEDAQLGLSLTAQVVKYEYDCILERFNSIQFGNIRKTLSGLLSNISKNTNNSSSISGSNAEYNSYQLILQELPKQILQKVFPIGSIYINYNDINPASFIGGIWEKLPNKYYLINSTEEESERLIPAGLPNITGSVSGINMRGSSSNGITRSGAFLTSSRKTGIHIGCLDPKGDLISTLNFNAQNSNSIYGTSDTVAPQSMKVYMFRRIL